MDSRNIIQSLLDNLALYLKDRAITFERYRVNPIELEGRNDIKKARISLYESSETVTVKTGPEYANLSLQRYGMDVSVVRAYMRDDASRGELPLLDLRDAIVDWANILDAGALTGNRIYTFSYNGNAGITRNDKYVTMTLAFSAIRDVFTPLPDDNMYLTDNNGNLLLDYNNFNLTDYAN